MYKSLNICIKMVPLSFEKSNQILKEFMKLKENFIVNFR